MEQLPIFLNVRGRPVLLVGDGPAAEAKARLLEAAGARVVAEPVAGVRVAFVALDEPEGEAARLKAAGLLVNVVDRPELCDFTVPAIVDRAPVTVAVGTAGASATLAKALRERLEAMLAPGLGELARAVRASRAAVAARHKTADDRRRFWDAAMAPGGPLDPLAPPDDPRAAVDAVLATDVLRGDTLATVRLTSPDPDDLTLRHLRRLAQADTIFHGPDAPPAVLDRARRDAARVVCDAPPTELPPGRSVFIAGP